MLFYDCIMLFLLASGHMAIELYSVYVVVSPITSTQASVVIAMLTVRDYVFPSHFPPHYGIREFLATLSSFGGCGTCGEGVGGPLWYPVL